MITACTSILKFYKLHVIIVIELNFWHRHINIVMCVSSLGTKFTNSASTDHRETAKKYVNKLNVVV